MEGTVESCVEKLANSRNLGKWVKLTFYSNMDETLDESGPIQALESSWENLCDELEVSMENLSLSDVNYNDIKICFQTWKSLIWSSMKYGQLSGPPIMSLAIYLVFFQANRFNI